MNRLDPLARLTLRATLHCFTGCAIGEVLGLAIATALGVALAADTASIAVMETVDNTIISAIPGAMSARLVDGRFWWALALGLAIAFVAALPVNRWLIGRGHGHAVSHAHH